MSMSNEFEIIVAGGGLVGTTLACALAQAGARVALVENRAPAPQAQKSASDPRVFALTRASERILRNTGVWRHLPAERLSPFREMRVWENGAGIHFDSADLGEPCLGHILEHAALLAALEARAAELPDLHWLRPRQIAEFAARADHLEARLQDGHRLTAKLLVGADGADSEVRRLAGLPCDIRPYGHDALVCNVRTELPHAETAWQRFTPGGPLAFLPLAEPHTCSIVWSTAPEEAARLLALAADDFHAELETAFEGRLGAVLDSGPRAAYPLYRRHAARYVQPRLALVGDAAHTIHPLAGQGVNLGWLDAASLCEVLLEARRQRRDPGNLHTLRRYERWRKGDNLLMLGLMDGFKALFGTPLGPVQWARNLGLRLSDRGGPLKQFMMRYAMGLDGDLPALARAGGGETES